MRKIVSYSKNGNGVVVDLIVGKLTIRWDSAEKNKEKKRKETKESPRGYDEIDKMW